MMRKVAILAICLAFISCDRSHERRRRHKSPGANACVKVEPGSGPLAGGNLVEVMATGTCLFGPNTEIRFDGKPATIVDIRSDTELVCEVPPGDHPGLVDVVLIGEDGSGICDCVEPDAYEYAAPPGCLLVEPGHGPLAGGNLVEITALGPCQFGPNTEIRFGGKPAAIVDIRSPTELVAEVPPGDRPGPVDVILIGEDGSGICDCVERAGYEYAAGGCVRVEPGFGPLAGGNPVEVMATGMCLFGPNTEVYFGGKPATIIDIRSQTELVCEVPPGDRPGPVIVIVVGEDGSGNPCDCTQADAYEYSR